MNLARPFNLPVVDVACVATTAAVGDCGDVSVTDDVDAVATDVSAFAGEFDDGVLFEAGPGPESKLTLQISLTILLIYTFKNYVNR